MPGIRRGVGRSMDTIMPLENRGHEPLPPANLIARHPKGINARVLLTSVFGPYARDDEFGSRRINPMELYHNQFMLYTPAPGTPLYAEMLAENRMLEGIDVADMHGQDKFNFRHTAISREDSKRWLDWAFRRDFNRNGPSLYRICRTTLEGWRRHKDHPDERIRNRFNWEVRWLRTASSGLLWAMQQRMKKTNPVISAVISSLRRDIGDEFGPLPRVAGGLLGPFLLWTARREERRLGNGVTCEPSPIVDRRNWVPAGAQPAMHRLPQGANILFPATEPQ